MVAGRQAADQWSRRIQDRLESRRQVSWKADQHPVPILQSLLDCVQAQTHLCSIPVFSFLRQPTTRHCSHLLLAERRAARRPAAAAVDRYLLPTGPTAANPPHAASAAVNRWNRQTDRHRTNASTPPPYYARRLSITFEIVHRWCNKLINFPDIVHWVWLVWVVKS